MVSFRPHSSCHLVRTDVTDDAPWAGLVAEATRPSPERFLANLTVLEDRAADGASWESLRNAAMAVPGDVYSEVLFVADATARLSPAASTVRASSAASDGRASWRPAYAVWQTGCVLATVSFYYGHRDPVSVTAG